MAFKTRKRGTKRQRGQVFPVDMPSKSSLPTAIKTVKIAPKKMSKTMQILAQRDPKKQLAFIKQQETTRLSRAIAKIKGTMDFANFRKEAIEQEGKEAWLRAKIMADVKLLKVAVGAKQLRAKKYRGWKQDIYLVNGAYIRDKLEIDFTLASHNKVSSFIPQNEIWVDRAFARDDDDLNAILEHERKEIGLMDKGMIYEKAHDKALAHEKEIRKLLERARKR